MANPWVTAMFHPIVVYFICFCVFLWSFVLWVIVYFLNRHFVNPFMRVTFPFGKTKTLLMDIYNNGTFKIIPVFPLGKLRIDDKGNPVQDYEVVYKKKELIPEEHYDKIQIKKGKKFRRDRYVDRFIVKTNGFIHPQSSVRMLIRRGGEIVTLNKEFEPSALSADFVINFIKTKIGYKNEITAFAKNFGQKLNKVSFFAWGMFFLMICAGLYILASIFM